MDNLIQYGPAFHAFGAKLNYDTVKGELDIAEYPNREGARKIIDGALADIKMFEDTSNFHDGLSVIALADYVDSKTNPVTKTSRLNILTQIGILRDGRYVRQILERAKVNRSWHISEVPQKCSYFGELCTNRGISDTSHRRGRKSERNPNEYHLESSKGIGREQLVTPAVELLYDNIPEDMLISDAKARVSVQDITKLKPHELQELIERLQGEISARQI